MKTIRNHALTLYLELVKWLFSQCTNEDGLDYATVANSSKTLSGLKQQVNNTVYFLLTIMSSRVCKGSVCCRSGTGAAIIGHFDSCHGQTHTTSKTVLLEVTPVISTHTARHTTPPGFRWLGRYTLSKCPEGERARAFENSPSDFHTQPEGMACSRFLVQILFAPEF